MIEKDDDVGFTGSLFVKTRALKGKFLRRHA